MRASPSAVVCLAVRFSAGGGLTGYRRRRRTAKVPLLASREVQLASFCFVLISVHSLAEKNIKRVPIDGVDFTTNDASDLQVGIVLGVRLLEPPIDSGHEIVFHTLCSGSNDG